MANSGSVEGYLHIEGFERFGLDAFNKSKVRAGMRKVGRLVTARAKSNLKLGAGREGYPEKRTGELLKSIKAKVSRSGFLVRIAPEKTSGMKAYYPAYLHYGVRQGAGWRIAPRDNYMTDALKDSKDEVQQILQRTFADALLN